MRTSDERWAKLVAARVELERLTREASTDGLDSLRAERLSEAQIRVDELVADWNAAMSWGRTAPRQTGSAKYGFHERRRRG